MDIKRVSEIANRSSEAIRLYERMGIISPKRNQKNKYRDYSFDDLLTIMFCIQYKNMGFSLDEINQAINYQESQYFLEKLKGKRKQFFDEIQEKQKTLDIITRYIEEIEVSDYNVGMYWFERRPEIVVKPLKDIDSESFSIPVLSQWLSHLPMVRGCRLFSNQESQPIVSVYTEKIYAEENHLPLEDCSFYNDQLCLCTIMKIPQNQPFSLSTLSLSTNYLRERGLQQAGDITANILMRTYLKKGAMCYFKVFIPVR